VGEKKCWIKGFIILYVVPRALAASVAEVLLGELKQKERWLAGFSLTAGWLVGLLQ
jgi:hypothetical protein